MDHILNTEKTAHDNIIEVTDLDESQLWPYIQTSEVALLRCNEPDPGVFVAESPNVIRRAVAAGYKPLSFLVEDKMIGRDGWDVVKQFPQAPVYTASESVLKGITGFKLTRGLLALFKRKPLCDMESICQGKSRIAILEDVVNPTNVGAIFRSAAALGMEAVILTNGCSDPLYRRASRVSMGNVFLVPWTIMEKGKWPEDGMEILKNNGFKTAAMALSDESVSIDDQGLLAEEKLAVILGTEGDGLAKSTIADCDYTVKIPMSAGVDSLNVAAASAVAFWELGRKQVAGHAVR